MRTWKGGKVTLATEELRSQIRGKRIAVMANNTALDNDGRMLIDSIPKECGTEVMFFFAMEHGIRGNMQAGYSDNDVIDEKTGVRVVNLYDFPGRRPPIELIEKVDAVVFCAQDTGVRHWTFTPNMMLLMDEAAKSGREVIVLDRPNPIRGDIVEGACTEEKYVGKLLMSGFGYPLRHGMTIGELALMYNDICNVGCKLTVLPMKGWRRDMWYDETGLLWLPASPNIPLSDSPLYYAATGLLQSSNVSLGWGTTTPFRYVGAPWLDGEALAEQLNALSLSGAFFVQKYYQTNVQQREPVLCNGVFIVIHDRNEFRPVEAQLHIMDILARDKNFNLEHDTSHCRIRMGTDDLYNAWKSGNRIADFVPRWERDAAEFRRAREPYLLY